MRRNKLEAKLESANATENSKKELDQLINRAMSLVAELYRERPKRGDLLPWNRSFLRERLIDAR